MVTTIYLKAYPNAPLEVDDRLDDIIAYLDSHYKFMVCRRKEDQRKIMIDINSIIYIEEVEYEHKN